LADGRTAANAAALLIAADRFLDRFAIEAVVLTELAVLPGNDRRDHVAINAAERCPVLGNAVLVHQPGRRNRNGNEPVNDHQRQTDADEPDQGKNSETEQAEHSRLPIRCASEAKEKLPPPQLLVGKRKGAATPPLSVFDVPANSSRGRRR